MKAKFFIPVALVLVIAWLSQDQNSIDLNADLGSKTAQKHFFTGVKEQKEYDQPDKAAAWLANRRQTPNGENPAVLNSLLKQQIDMARSQKASSSSEQLPAFAFEDIGPGIFGGRIRAFAIHPNQAGVLLAGGVSGGIWKSTDDGKSWHNKNDFLPNMAIGSMVVDADNPNRVFVGTGEGFFNFDAARGAGIYVSEDFGETWSVLSNTVNDNFYYVNRLARVADSDVLLAATRNGIFRSSNLGQSWSEVSGVNVTNRGFVDLKADPNDNQHLLAVHYGGSNDALNLVITAPSSIAGNYEATVAAFGGAFGSSGISGEIVQVNDGSGVVDDACQSINNNLSGKIALIQRGTCNFTVKVKYAQQAGAIAALIYQNSDDAVFTMGGEDDSITIPAAMVLKTTGEAITGTTATVSGNVTETTKDPLGRFVMESTDGGETWERLENRGLPKLKVGRMELNFAADGTTYVAVSNADHQTLGLWRSAGRGQNFEKTASDTDFIERQGWYDLAVAVNPNDSNHVLIGAVDQYVTHNGGATINKNSYWQPGSGKVAQYIHSDHHGYFFSPHNTNHIYVVSDGGVSKSEDGGDSYFQLNNGLKISQSYGIAVSPDGERLTSGTQDNGSQMYYGDDSDWFEWRGGDGGYSAWDQQQGQYVYGSYTEGQMYGSADRGVTTTDMELPDRDGAAFIQPFVLDEANGNRMMVGTDNVFLTNNARSLGNASWSDVSNALDGSSISALAFNPHNDTQAFVGTANGNIYRISSLGSSNLVTDITPTAVNGSTHVKQIITDIKVSPYGNRLYVTMGGYYPNRLISTPFNDSSWRSESANLPDIPLYQISFDPNGDGRMFVGSELGLWSASNSSSGADHWYQYDYGVAYVRVIDLIWHGADTLFVGTHGRGTFKAVRQPISVELERFVATNSSCDDDAYLDSGETGLFIVNLKNQSAKTLNNVQLSWTAPSQITASTNSQTIGSLDAYAEAAVAIEVQLENNSACLSNLEIPFSIQHDQQTYQQSVSLMTSANRADPSNAFDNESGSKMTAEMILGNDPWHKVTDHVYSGNDAWFSANDATYADKSLVSPWLTLDEGEGGNVLQFALRYSMEGNNSQYYDGVVLEMRQQGGRWFDIGNLSSAPYDGHLYVNNPAKGRLAWSGSQLNWRAARVDLAAQYVGKTIQFRFRNLSDSNTAEAGFWVDAISMSNAYTAAGLTCDECNSNTDNNRPNLGMWYDPAHDGHGFVVDSVGYNDQYYTIFYTYDDDGNPEWYNSVGTLENSIADENINRVTWSDSNEDNITTTAVGRLSIDFDSARAAAHSACQDGNTIRNLAQSALATWQIGSQQQTWCIQAMVAEQDKPAVDFGGSWWAGQDENGWGFSVVQARSWLGTVIFYYDADGNPRWAIGTQATTDFAAGSSVTINLSHVIGYGRLSTPQATDYQNNGQVTLTLNNRYLDLDVDGTADLTLSYLGTEGGDWNREQIAIAALTRLRWPID